MKIKNKEFVSTLTIFVVLLFSSNQVASKPIAIAFMEGYAFGDQDNTIGINSLNTDVRNSLVGQNYFSRVFNWDQVDEATNYFSLFTSSTNYLVGYSRGGYQALRVAENLNQKNVSLQNLTQLDPVRCGGTNSYASDNVLNCWVDLEKKQIVSTGPQVVPTNVVKATNYYQTGGGFQGERNVIGANNIDVNNLLGDSSINHSNIDDNGVLRSRIVNDVVSYKDTNVLMNGLGGASGFGTLAMTRNDDGSTGAIQLPFNVNFNGKQFDKFYVNNNGNITFGGAYGEFTPTSFDSLPVEMIAPYWSDVDTSCENCGEVYLAVPTSDVAVITWNNVGHFSANSSKQNTFQLVLRDRNDLKGTNTDVEFRYDKLKWTTGDASGGEDGLGGQPAFAGYTSGPNGTSQTLIGSGSSGILDLTNKSNINESGRWFFPFRDGSSPGTTLSNPLLPDVQTDGWHFQFTTTQIDQVVWSDPEVVYGYDYKIDGEINFRSFILPVLGDNDYELWIGDRLNPIYLANVIGGSEYLFSDIGYVDGVDFFRILGVETALAIDPLNTSAFVTGLTFTQTGRITWVQAPLSIETTIPVSEPPSYYMMLLGILSFISYGRKRRKNNRI